MLIRNRFDHFSRGINEIWHETGLGLMIQNGSFNKHLMKYYQQDIEKAKLYNRKLFKIHNPLLPATTPLNCKELWIDLTK